MLNCAELLSDHDLIPWSDCCSRAPLFHANAAKHHIHMFAHTEGLSLSDLPYPLSIYAFADHMIKAIEAYCRL